MRTLITLALLTLTTVLTGCSGIPTIAMKDTRCQWNQYCPYTDPPSAIRTEPIRYNSVTPQYSGSVYVDPAVR
jgi:hypothetical protein